MNGRRVFAGLVEDLHGDSGFVEQSHGVFDVPRRLDARIGDQQQRGLLEVGGARVIDTTAGRLVIVRTTATEVAALSAEFGLDQSVPVQYWRYLTGLLHGDWGRSLQTRGPVLEDLKVYIPATLELVMAAMAIASCRTTTLQGSSNPMSGSVVSARCASGGLQAPRMR